MRKCLLALAVAALVFVPFGADAVDVTTCGQIVPRGQVGVLTGDLNCTTRFGVQLEERATLDLAGHTLSVTDDGQLPLNIAVFCASGPDLIHGSCRVLSSAATPGVVAGDGAVYSGILGKRVRVENVDVDGFATYGIIGSHKTQLSGVSVSGVGDVGVVSTKKIKASEVTVQGNGQGIFAPVVRLENVSVNANDSFGISGLRVIGKEIEVTGNTPGILARRALRLRLSNVTGNTIDLLSSRRPSLRDTTCDVSRKIADDGSVSTESWGVCAGD
jgi:hypothetical protein